MRYLLDANVLIDADRDYYSLDRVPEFWDWLLHQSARDVIAIPSEMYGEVIAGKGALVDWLKKHKDTLILDAEADPVLLNRVLSKGYAPQLTEYEVDEIGNDPFVVAYALSSAVPATVVTTEISKPSRKRANRRLPDVCNACGVRSINTFALVRELNFSTGWRTT